MWSMQKTEREREKEREKERGQLGDTLGREIK